MMHYRRIGISLAAAAVAEIFNKIIPFILLRLAMQRLGVEAFGASQYLLWMADILSFLVVFGFPQFSAIQLGQVQFPSNDANRIITAQLCGRIFLAALVGIFLTAYGAWSSERILSPTGWAVVGLAVIFSSIDMYPIQLARSRLASFSSANIVAKVFSLVAIWFFVVDSSDAEVFALCSVLANGIVSLISIYVARQEIRLAPISIDDFTRQLRGAAKFAPSILLLIGLERFDFFFVERFFDPLTTGSYAAAGRLVQSIIPVIYGVGHVFLAELIQNRSFEAQRVHLSICVEILSLLASCVVATCVLFSAPLIQLIYGSPNYLAAEFLEILVVGLGMHSIYVVFGVLVLPLQNRIAWVNLSLGFALGAGLLWVALIFNSQSPYELAWANIICRGGAALACALAARDVLHRGMWISLLRGILPALGGWLAMRSISGTYLVNALIFAGITAAIAVWIQRSRINWLVAKIFKRNESAQSY